MRKIEVCLSPEMIHLFDLKGKIAVVVDVLRATSCMVTAMANGVQEIKPVCELHECKSLQLEGYIGAAERGGVKEEGFRFGNSPFSYIDNSVKGEKLAMTTTNGTIAIEKSKSANQVVIGALINKTAVYEYLKQFTEDVVVVCAGWKGHVNMEDSMFAGALIDAFAGTVECGNDSAILAETLYVRSKKDISAAMSNCNHVKRLSGMNDIGKDIEFCFQEDVYKVVPVLEGESLVPRF